MNDNFIPTTLGRGAALARLLSRIDGSTVYLRLVEISDARRQAVAKKNHVMDLK